MYGQGRVRSCHRDMTGRHGHRTPLGGTVSGMDFDVDDPPGGMFVYGSEPPVRLAFPTLHDRTGS